MRDRLRMYINPNMIGACQCDIETEIPHMIHGPKARGNDYYSGFGRLLYRYKQDAASSSLEIDIFASRLFHCLAMCSRPPRNTALWSLLAKISHRVPGKNKLLGTGLLPKDFSCRNANI